MTMLCDLTIAAEDALFGEPEIRFAGPATAMMMPWVIGLKRARELIYMGDMIGAAEAKEIGMVNRVVPADQLEGATLKYARRLALIGPEALFCARTAINRILEAQGIRHGLQQLRRSHRAHLRYRVAGAPRLPGQGDRAGTGGSLQVAARPVQGVKMASFDFATLRVATLRTNGKRPSRQDTEP